MGLKNLKPLSGECLEHFQTLLCLRCSHRFSLPLPLHRQCWGLHTRGNLKLNRNHHPQIPLFSEHPPLIMGQNAEMTSFPLQDRLPGELPADDHRLRGFGCLGYSSGDTHRGVRAGKAKLLKFSYAALANRCVPVLSSRCRTSDTETPVKQGKLRGRG